MKTKRYKKFSESPSTQYLPRNQFLNGLDKFKTSFHILENREKPKKHPKRPPPQVRLKPVLFEMLDNNLFHRLKHFQLIKVELEFSHSTRLSQHRTNSGVKMGLKINSTFLLQHWLQS